MKRIKAIETIVKALDGSEAVISTLGLISRELYENFDSERNFYMVGSMGLASSIALGIAINKPQKRIIVVDGDGSLLMNLGSMANVGYISPKNLTHIVLDNGAYASCSEEPTVSTRIRLEEIAKAPGYNYIRRVQNEDGLYASIRESAHYNGPSFILVEIELGGNRHPARILDLPRIKERFRNFLAE